MGCPNRGWHRSLHPQARKPAHVRRQSSSEATCFGNQWAKTIEAPLHGRIGPNGSMHRDRSYFAQSGHRLQISLCSHIGRTLQLRKLPLPPLPRTLRARHQRRIGLVASEALRLLETRIAMRLSDWSLRGLVGVNLFEPKLSERKQQMYRGYCKCVCPT
jgi:hypothetical protein